MAPLFKLQSVSIVGARTIPLADLKPAYRRYLGTQVSKHDLEGIAAAVSDVYRQHGYHLSRAIVPPQDVKGGRLIVRVIEGSIIDIRLTGGVNDRFGIRDLLNPILEEHPSRLQTVERQLLLANDRPGVRVSDVALEEIGTATGQFRLIVKIETWTIGAGVALDNLGTYAVGPLQTYAGASLNSYLRPGDALSMNIATVPDSVRDLRYGRVGYDVPVIEGLRLGISALRSVTMPNDDRRLTDTRTLTDAYEVHASVIALATRENWLSLGANAVLVDSSQSEIAGMDYADHIRMFGLSADYRFRDPLNGLSFANLSWRQGLSVFAATQTDDPLISRYGATPNFSVLSFSYTRLQPIYGAWSLKASIAGQLASGPLMSSQEFYLGGAAFGPGYYSGDDGYAGVAELRFDQGLNSAIVKAYQVYGFIDGGQTWYLHNDKQTLSSVGGGLRLDLGNDIQAGIAVAAPLSYTSKTDEWRRARLLFSISSALKVCPERGWGKCS